MAFNKIILQGRITADPEAKQTTSGVSVCRFTLAVDRRFKGENGAKEADFIEVVAWRQTADFVAKYFAKGQEIIVCGSLQMRKWEDKQGNKRVSAEVVADEATFSGVKVASDSEGSASSKTYMPDAYKPAPQYEEMAEDDTLPF